MADVTPKPRVSTIDQILDAMRKNGPERTMLVADVIRATNRPAPTVYSVIYGEAKKPNARVVRVEKGTFKLTSAGREPTQ
jgi:hypothetical protein